MKLEEMDIELKSMDESAGDAHKTIDMTQSDLNAISEELAALYYQVCTVQGVTPQVKQLIMYLYIANSKSFIVHDALTIYDDVH